MGIAGSLAAGQRRVFLANTTQQLSDGLAAKRRRAGQQFVKNRAKRENIAARIQLFPAGRLFRRKVLGRAGHLADFR